MMISSSRNRRITFILMFAIMGVRLLIFTLDIAGIITWGPYLGVSILSWILPVGMPAAVMIIMLLRGRKKMGMHPQMPKDLTIPLSEILRERLDRGEITKDQYSEMKKILDKT